MPFAVDGPRTDPPVSVPSPTCAYAAAIAAPVPPDDPEGVRVRSCGFRVRPPSELIAPPEANSLMLTLARMMAPASRSFRTRKASSGGSEPASMTEPAVVGMSVVSRLSFRTTGIPCSGDRGPSAARSASRARALAVASGFSAMTALRAGPGSS